MSSVPLTEDALGVIWNGEERAGILLYGYRQGAGPTDPFEVVLPWPDPNESRMMSLSDIHHDPPVWTILEWTVLLSVWPAAADRLPLLESALAEVCRRGATVAWAGLEGHFADPPSLFLPEEMSGGVWASYSPRIGLRCAARLGEPFGTLDDACLAELRAQIPLGERATNPS